VEDVVEGEDEGVEEELAMEGVSRKNHMIWIYLWGRMLMEKMIRRRKKRKGMHKGS
jgi:hypothetical protein